MRGIDLVSMLYDYGPNDSRSVPKKIAETYQEQTEARSKAYREMMSYLAQTGQSEMYAKLKDGMEALDAEAAISKQINSELKLPEPTRRSGSSIETRKTIDTFKGRAVLHESLKILKNVHRLLDMITMIKQPKYKVKQKIKMINYQLIGKHYVMNDKLMIIMIKNVDIGNLDVCNLNSIYVINVVVKIMINIM